MSNYPNPSNHGNVETSCIGCGGYTTKYKDDGWSSYSIQTFDELSASSSAALHSIRAGVCPGCKNRATHLLRQLLEGGFLDG